MSRESIETRDRIKSRMLKNTSQLWGNQLSDISSYDPLVNLLLGACSLEMEKIYNELNNSHSRVLERLSKLLIPEVNKGPVPAHAVAHARSVEPTAQLARTDQFYFSKTKIAAESTVRKDYKDVFFTPAVNALLMDGDIRHVVTGTLFCELNDVVKKDIIWEADRPNHACSFLWLSLKLENRIESIDGLKIYFDWVSNPDKQRFFNLLKNVKARIYRIEENKIIAQEVNSYIGFSDSDKLAHENDIFTNSLDINSLTENRVVSYYNERFLTLSWNKSQWGSVDGGRINFPQTLLEFYSEKKLAGLQDNLVWIELEFPAYVKAQMLNEVFCAINCFPVINRRFNEFRYRLQTAVNIIPLSPPNEFFYSMRSVKNNHGSVYTLSSASDLNKVGEAQYVLRHGGIERFDKRNAYEFLSYVISLLRDESAAFQVYGQEMITEELIELRHILTSIEQKVNMAPSADVVTYLIIKSKLSAFENVFIEFWSTDGNFANNIATERPLSVYDNCPCNGKNLVLVSPTVGGRDPLSSGEMLNAYKSALLSRDRMVTKEDIKFMVKKEFGGLVQNIRIKKKYSIAAAAQHGFEDYIEVALTPSRGNAMDVVEWQTRIKGLETKLESNSSGFIAIRVKLEEHHQYS